MKKQIILILLYTISFISNGQDKGIIQAQIGNYKTSDTISINDLLNIGEISLNKNDYLVISFGLDLMDCGFLKEFKSNSNKFTEEMNRAILDLKNKNMKVTKIFFENITVLSPQGKKMTIGGLLHILKIK